MKKIVYLQFLFLLTFLTFFLLLPSFVFSQDSSTEDRPKMYKFSILQMGKELKISFQFENLRGGIENSYLCIFSEVSTAVSHQSGFTVMKISSLKNYKSFILNSDITQGFFEVMEEVEMVDLPKEKIKVKMFVAIIDQDGRFSRPTYYIFTPIKQEKT